jgi:hypothetical protein
VELLLPIIQDVEGAPFPAIVNQLSLVLVKEVVAVMLSLWTWSGGYAKRLGDHA